jgi:hypothetical protein
MHAPGEPVDGVGPLLLVGELHPPIGVIADHCRAHVRPPQARLIALLPRVLHCGGVPVAVLDAVDRPRDRPPGRRFELQAKRLVFEPIGLLAGVCGLPEGQDQPVLGPYPKVVRYAVAHAVGNDAREYLPLGAELPRRPRARQRHQPVGAQAPGVRRAELQRLGVAVLGDRPQAGRHRRQARQRPAHPQQPVAATTAVGQCQLWRRASTALRDPKRQVIVRRPVVADRELSLGQPEVRRAVHQPTRR